MTSTRVTQRMIAQMAGVSQSTVSLVLNGKAGGDRRIPEETRERVLEVIRETTYVANPVARSLVGATSDLIGVFTYEPAFPDGSSDFYAPLLTGIEHAAEQVGADLLVFTSTPVVEGRRRLFHESNRLRLADGCILLGRVMDGAELGRLIASRYPFVAVGRRDLDGVDVPYVGVDYTAATRSLGGMIKEAGHRRVVLFRLSLDGESTRDRRSGLLEGLSTDVPLEEIEISDSRGVLDAWEQIRHTRPSVVVVEDPMHAQTLTAHLRTVGVSLPEDLSIVALGEHHQSRERDIDFTRLRAPRAQIGARAVELLMQQLSQSDEDASSKPVQELLPCVVVPGETLAPPGA